jgi:nucleoside-diphosphate-sugar epimerase
VVPRQPEGRICLIHGADVADAVARLAPRRDLNHTYELSDRRTDGYRWDEIVDAMAAALGVRPRRLAAPTWLLPAVGIGAELAAMVLRRPLIMGMGKAREIAHGSWGSTPERQPPPDVWTAGRDLATGFAETVDWYRAAGLLPGSGANFAGDGKRY